MNDKVLQSKLKRLAVIQSDSEVSQLEDDAPASWLHNPKIEEMGHDAFLTGKAAARGEIDIYKLSESDRALFDASMAKEWASGQKFGAVEILTEQQVQDLPDDTPIVGTRWAHTDKNKRPRLLAAAMSKRTEKTPDQIKKEFPFEAKSRMVVQGHQEEGHDGISIRTDSPTASLLAFNLICSVAVLHDWAVWACDASTAYLQSSGISWLLILRPPRPPRPPPPGVSPMDLFRAKGSIYGTKDAGRSWWKKLFKTVQEHGWQMSKYEAALFYLFEENKLIGVMASHVDDLFCTGTGDKLEVKLYLKVHKNDFRFCGKNVKVTSNSIDLDQYDAIEGVEYMVVDKERRKMPNASLTAAEKTDFRGLIGSLGWITRQTRPDLQVKSLASQTMASPAIKDVVELNKAVKMLKDTCDNKYRFVKHQEMTWDNIIVAVFADSSFANSQNMKSQCGYIVVLTTEEIKSGASAPIMLLETYSGSIKRVCRSTLAAEANAFLMATEAGDYVRSLLMEMKFPGTSVQDVQEYKKGILLAFTDAKSLESMIVKDAGQPTDKRVKILVAQIKDLLGYGSYVDDEQYVIWCDTSQMLADVLTKAGCERTPLLRAMEEGRWQLEPSEEAKLRKLGIRAGRQRRKSAKKAAHEAESRTSDLAEEGCEFVKKQQHSSPAGHS